jgi:hypothetical protein
LGARLYRVLWVAAIAMLAYTPAHAFTLEWPPATTPVDGYDVEETTDNGLTFKVIGSVPPCVTLCSYTIPEPTTGRPQWRVVIKANGWRSPSIGFYGVDKGIKPSYTTPPVPPAPLPVDAMQVKP